MSAPAVWFDQPYAVDARGRSATTEVDDHVRDLIAAVLFTSPGERVMHPDFGCGLRQLVFAPNSDVLATATEALCAAALNRWLADWIVVDQIEVRADEATLLVRLSYRRRDVQEPQLLTLVST
jgi:phage baseplate assembly protein W